MSDRDTNPATTVAEGGLSIAVVILTTGQRNAELQDLARSLSDQELHERLLIVNGGDDIELDGWTQLALAENIGVPAGRSLGASTSTADVVVYLDDDCALVSSGLIQQVATRFEHRPRLGALGFRIQTPAGGAPMRRWVPSTSAPEADGLRPSTTFPGGGHAIRRSAFLEVGGYCDELFFKHEETDLTWKLLDNGWEVAYDEHCIVEHPQTSEGRHPMALRVGVRNKIWLARMALPATLVPFSLVIAVVRYLGRCRRVSDLLDVLGGVRAGFQHLPAHRSPMQWRTVRMLATRGRLPIF